MVAQQELQIRARAHGDALRAGKVITFTRHTLPLEIAAYVGSDGCCADGGSHPLTVAVICEVGADRPADRGQPALGIVGQEVARAVFQAQGHVTVGIVAGCQGVQPDHEAQRAGLGQQLGAVDHIHPVEGVRTRSPGLAAAVEDRSAARNVPSLRLLTVTAVLHSLCAGEYRAPLESDLSAPAPVDRAENPPFSAFSFPCQWERGDKLEMVFGATFLHSFIDRFDVSYDSKLPPSHRVIFEKISFPRQLCEHKYHNFLVGYHLAHYPQINRVLSQYC